MDADQQKRILDLTKKTIRDYESNYIEGPLGYRFRTYDFLCVAYLYYNSLDTKNTDIIGSNNKNTFVNDILSVIRKIKEQVRIDLKDINFLINGSSPMARFIMRGGNNKMLRENYFSKEIDLYADDIIVYGSGYLKVWQTPNKKQRIKSIDPYALIFDTYDFANGLKIERIRTTPREVVENEMYDLEARAKIVNKLGDKSKEEYDKGYTIYQVVKPVPKKSEDDEKLNDIYIVDTEHDVVLYSHMNDNLVEYYKCDYEKRRGFPDAHGKGIMEIMFNVIVQSKVGRERLDKVMAIATTLPLQKKVDNEKDNLVGAEILKARTGYVLGYKENPIEPMNLGGEKQIALLRQELTDLAMKASTQMNVGDALNGNTLPSGTSGALGNLLTENASSVHKETKKEIGNSVGAVYTAKLNKYLLSTLDSNTNLRKYLDPNDIKLIEMSLYGYLVLRDQINAELTGKPFDLQLSHANAKNEISKSKEIIPGDILKQLQDDVKGIEPFITGEQISKPKIVAFIREMRLKYETNPQVFTDPFYRALILREAQYDSGMSELEIGQLLKELDNQ